MTPLLYALSVASRSGLRRGRPRPRRLIQPVPISVANALLSWNSPPVTVKITGLPRPSARMWILVEKPPRERPSASPSIPLFAAGLPGASRVLMSANDGAVHEVQALVHPALAIGAGLQGFLDGLPNSGAAPAQAPCSTAGSARRTLRSDHD